jgi:putative copper export protein
MSSAELLKWIHLLAAATWTGGLITLAALVPAMRSAGAERPLLQAVARQFGRVSWVALGVAVVTGIWQVELVGYPWADLTFKLTLVVIAAGLALVHQLTARRSTAAMRGLLQGVILLTSIGIFGAAVALFG